MLIFLYFVKSLVKKKNLVKYQSDWGLCRAWSFSDFQHKTIKQTNSASDQFHFINREISIQQSSSVVKLGEKKDP